LQENARIVGAALLARLRELQKRYEVIGAFAQGLMMAIELVKDVGRSSDTSDDGAGFRRDKAPGLVVSKSGPYRSVLRIVPPLCSQCTMLTM